MIFIIDTKLTHPSATATATVYPEPTPEVPPTSEETGPPLSSPNDTFPVIPTGTALIDPVVLAADSTSCDISAQDDSLPGWFKMGADLLWSCAYDQGDTSEALKWRFERGPINLTNMELYPSEPDFLRGAEYGEGVWGGYVVSSAEGITKWEIGEDNVEIGVNGDVVEYSGKSSWRDGTQNQAFWRIPFAFYNTTESSSYKSKKKQLGGRSTIRRGLGKRSTGNGLWSRSGDHPLDDSYKFGLLFNKTVIVKQTTIDSNVARDDGVIKSGDGTALLPGEIVWKCVWEKTLLEVEVMTDIPSTAIKNQKETDGDGDEDGGNDSDDDDDHTTTILSSTIATPTSTISANSSLTKTDQQVPSPTGCPYQPNCPHYNGDASFPNIPPPPPPSHSHNVDDFFGLKHPPQATETPTTNGNLTRRFLKRHVERSTPTPYPLKISIKESRPTSARIRRLLGMDLTDPDPKGRANLGEVACTRYVVTVKGGLTPLVDHDTGEGYVKLNEIPSSKGRLKERGDSTCYCKWNS